VATIGQTPDARTLFVRGHSPLTLCAALIEADSAFVRCNAPATPHVVTDPDGNVHLASLRGLCAAHTTRTDGWLWSRVV
jgi:hypothetical protein